MGLIAVDSSMVLQQKTVLGAIRDRYMLSPAFCFLPKRRLLPAAISRLTYTCPSRRVVYVVYRRLSWREDAGQS